MQLVLIRPQRNHSLRFCPSAHAAGLQYCNTAILQYCNSRVQLHEVLNISSSARQNKCSSDCRRRCPGTKASTGALMHEKIHGFIAISNLADDEGYNGSEGVIHQKATNVIRFLEAKLHPRYIGCQTEKVYNSGMRSEVAFEIKACHGNCNLEIEENP